MLDSRIPKNSSSFSGNLVSCSECKAASFCSVSTRLKPTLSFESLRRARATVEDFARSYFPLHCLPVDYSCNRFIYENVMQGRMMCPCGLLHTSHIPYLVEVFLNLVGQRRQVGRSRVLHRPRRRLRAWIRPAASRAFRRVGLMQVRPTAARPGPRATATEARVALEARSAVPAHLDRIVPFTATQDWTSATASLTSQRRA